MPAFLTARLIAYGLAGAAILAGALWVRHEWNAGQRARERLPQLQAQVAALEESARLTGTVMAQAEARVETVVKERERVRTVYRDAVRTDPTCAEWARQPVACPLGGP